MAVKMNSRQYYCSRFCRLKNGNLIVDDNLDSSRKRKSRYNKDQIRRYPLSKLHELTDGREMKEINFDDLEKWEKVSRKQLRTMEFLSNYSSVARVDLTQNLDRGKVIVDIFV